MSTNSNRLISFCKTHLGVMHSAIWGLVAAAMFFSGAFLNLDEYLSALVFQIGYKPGQLQDSFTKGEFGKLSSETDTPAEKARYEKVVPLTNPLFLVKKDELTSSLIQSNPGRQEYASIIRFLGNPRKQKIPGSGQQSFDAIDFRLGYFSGEEKPVTTSFTLPAASWGSVGIAKLTEQLVRFFDFINFPRPADLASASSNASEKIKDQLLNPADPTWKALSKMAVGIDNFSTEARVRIFPKPNIVLHFQWRFHVTPPDSFLIPPAKVIALDFLLQGEKEPQIDNELSQAIANSQTPIVLAGQANVEVEQGKDTRFTANSFASGTYGRDIQQREEQVSIVLPHKPFLEVCTNVGFINVGQSKGFVRRVPLFIFDSEQKKLRPSFSILTAAISLDRQQPFFPEQQPYQKALYAELNRINPQYQEKTYSGGFQLYDIAIPCDAHGNMEVFFFGSTQRITEGRPMLRSASFYECLDEPRLNYFRQLNPENASKLVPEAAYLSSTSRDKPRNYGDKICLLGTFERSDFDFYETPLTLKTPTQIESERLMGIEIHANAILTILNRKFLRSPSSTHTFLLLFFATLLLGFIIDRVKPLWGGVATLVGLSGIFGLAFFSFHHLGQILYISPFFLSFPLSWFSSTLIGYLQQQARAKTIKSMFQRFVSADVVQYMIDHPEKVAPGGQKVELTVFFSDVAGFTSISEMLTPEELVVLLNEYLGAMTEILFEYHGTLDKFIGDAVMAFWNFPSHQDDHALRACLCALRMQEKIRELQVGWAKRGLPKVSARAGINTAQVVVGYMGSDKAQMNFTCMGDGVNLASRLEGANKEYGTDLMVSDACFQQVRHRVTARFLDFLAVKGKKEPVKVHNLICEKGKEPPGWEDFITLYDRAIKQHLDRQWDQAIETFEQLLIRWPNDGPSKTYITRCREYKENPPPPNWDGSYHLTHK